ncbi:uncharacterized protein B0H18DRAFT_1003009 [Fomitopsis serialis]|uniref:uncharacterized protein n=1 Tax=Fomitopsis serialis TaxID=139415 RepID=UPI0020073BF4|nr:uncharacterized protein B0H18DRAFT_1003009 [Neoantrodia serialis]KAH9927652.1 hypothetical protein B0H18DRAFT_1003009 [Neoantrodia serialis]
MIVQFFYAWRIWKLTNNYFAVAVILMTSLVGGLSGIGTAIAVTIKPAFSGFQNLKVIVILWLLGGAVCDVLITLALSWHLRQRRTGFRSTDTIISRIIQVTVSNGLLTAGFAVADIIAFLATPRGIHVAFNYTLIKLYGNSMMSSLNSRTLLTPSRDRTFSHGMNDDSGSGRNTEGSVVHGDNSKRTPRPAQLVVNVETHELVDVSGASRKSDPEWVGSGYSHSDVKDVVAI